MAGTQRSSNLGKRLILVNMAWLLMPDGLVWECQKLMIYWDFPHTNSSKILQRIKLCKKTSCWCQRSVESSQTTNELIGRRKAWVFVLSAKNRKMRLQFICKSNSFCKMTRHWTNNAGRAQRRCGQSMVEPNHVQHDGANTDRWLKITIISWFSVLAYAD